MGGPWVCTGWGLSSTSRVSPHAEPAAAQPQIPGATVAPSSPAASGTPSLLLPPGIPRAPTPPPAPTPSRGSMGCWTSRSRAPHVLPPLPRHLPPAAISRCSVLFLAEPGEPSPAAPASRDPGRAALPLRTHRPPAPAGRGSSPAAPAPSLSATLEPGPGARSAPPAAGLVSPGLQQQRLEAADGDGGDDGAQQEDAEQDPRGHAQQALPRHPVVAAQPHEPEIAAHGAPAPRGDREPAGRGGTAAATRGGCGDTHWQRGPRSGRWVQMPWFLQ